jgi:ribosome maturation factor RimP
MASTESIRELAEPILDSAGLELWDVEITRDVVRIMVDRPGGVDLDALSAASGVLSPVLDGHPELVPDTRYQLEISSPGVERTLRTPAQYQRYVGAEITVKTSIPVEGARRHRGRLVDAGEAGITLEPDDGAVTSLTSLHITYDQIDRARTVLVWGSSAGRPAGGRRGPGRPASGRATVAPNSKDAAS